tara:strand:- start:285 stop:956 length:672 start_codon:yes stop_codon:yes gene_type:complete
MHIEPGIVEGGKMALGFFTGAGSITYIVKKIIGYFSSRKILFLLLRSLICTLAVFCFFEVLPHFPVGVSEVHFILGSTLFLIFGTLPAAIGLIFGLLMQGILFSPTDLPQYGMNITTLLVPLFTLNIVAKKFISTKTPYVDLKYSQTFALSAVYQLGVISWVAFWAFYGLGIGVNSLTSILSFGLAYSSVIVIEFLIDLLLLALAKSAKLYSQSTIFTYRLYN